MTRKNRITRKYVKMVLAAITNLLKNNGTKLDYRINAVKVLRDLVLARCNQTIKLFLEIPVLKIVLACACISFQIKEKLMPETELFAETDANTKSKRQAFIDEMLATINLWKINLSKDHKGKATFFLMIFRSVYEPDHILLNQDAKNLIDFFQPTELDPYVVKFKKFLSSYQDLLEKFSPRKSAVERAHLESSIQPIKVKGQQLLDELREFYSKPQ